MARQPSPAECEKETRLMSVILNTGTARILGYTKPIARILTSTDGGPVRRIIDGRKTVYTGFFISVKANFGQMPWESRGAEKSAMILAEGSSRVVSLLAQPHRLEMFVAQQKKPLIYFPDLQLRAHPSFVEDLDREVPFSVAALAPSFDEPDENFKTVILEMKSERDRRQHTPRYQAKIELAKEVYERLGYVFRTIQREEEIFQFQLRIAASVVSWRHTAVNQLDVWTVQKILRSGARPAQSVVEAIGGGPFGWAKLRAMHVRRILELDLTDQVAPTTDVRLLLNNSLHVSVAS